MTTPTRRPPWALLAPAGIAAAVAVLPLGYLVVRAFERGATTAAEVVWRGRTVELVARSLLLATVVTAACLVLGIATAWLTTRTDLPGRRAWAVLAVLPLAVPSYVAAYVWISLAPGVAGFGGAALVLTLCCYPYVHLPVVAALRRADPAAEEVARSLGHGPWRTFTGVTLRQVRPAATAGGLLVVLYVLSDFGAVAIMRYDVFTRVIYSSYRASFDRTPAAVLGLLLVVVTVAVSVAEARARGRADLARIGAGAARRTVPVVLGRARPLALAGTGGLAALALGVPAAGLTYWLLRGDTARIDLASLAAATATTAWVAALGAVATVALALPVGILAARHRTRLVTWLEQATFAGHALPGIVVGLALVFFGIRFAEPVYQRTPMLVLGYVVLFLPLAVGAVRTSVAQSPPRLEEVARSLGRTPRQVLREVTLPLAAPGVAAGTLLVLLTAMKELPATLLLRPTGVDTLATRLWTQTDNAAYAAAAPYAAALVLLAAVPAFLLAGRHREAGPPGTVPADAHARDHDPTTLQEEVALR